MFAHVVFRRVITEEGAEQVEGGRTQRPAVAVSRCDEGLLTNPNMRGTVNAEVVAGVSSVEPMEIG